MNNRLCKYFALNKFKFIFHHRLIVSKQKICRSHTINYEQTFYNQANSHNKKPMQLELTQEDQLCNNTGKMPRPLSSRNKLLITTL